MADPAYSFGVLGALLVERDGEPLQIASGHQRILLALLLASDQPYEERIWGQLMVALARSSRPGAGPQRTALRAC